jgi:hypothetical protein
MLRSQARVSFWAGQLLAAMHRDGTYADGCEYVGIDVESLLMDARGQCWVEALRQSQRNRVAMGDDGDFRGVRLQGLCREI